MATGTTMAFSVEEAGPCRKRVKVTIPTERVSEEFDKSYRQWTRTVPIPGFRPGKAPRNLVEKRFGKQIALEVKQSLLDSAYEEALKSNELAPIADPEIDVESIEVAPDGPVDFDFTITVKPEFELPQLKEIEVAVPPADPTDDEIDRALRALRKRKATLRPLDEGKIESEDVVTLRVRGRAGGEEELFHDENLAYEVGSRLVGDLVAEGLDEALLGKKAGAKVEAKGFVPPHLEGHPLAGTELDLEAEVLDLKRPELPEVDDAFAKSYDFDSSKELVETVRKDVRLRKEQERERLIENLALARLLETVEITLPEELIEKEADDLARRAAYELQMQGKQEDEIAREVAELRARRSEESAQELRAWFVLDKLVEQERILVTETEVREAVGQIAAYYGRTPEQMYASLRDAGRLPSLRNQLREKKARALLRRKVKVVDAPAEQKKGAGGKGPAKKTASKKTAAKKTATKTPKKKTTKKKASDA